MTKQQSRILLHMECATVHTRLSLSRLVQASETAFWLGGVGSVGELGEKKKPGNPTVYRALLSEICAYVGVTIRGR